MRTDLKFTADWFTKSIHELTEYSLPLLKGRNNLQVLEIGSFEGLSSRWFIDNILQDEGSSLCCIDTWNGSAEHNSERFDIPGLYERFLHNMKEHIDSGKCTHIRGMSSDVLPRLIAGGKTYDMVFIDGSHVSSDVAIDGILSYLLLKPGGVMVFDDYIWGLGDMQYKDIPYPSIDFIRNCFVSTGRLELIATGVMATFKKII